MESESLYRPSETVIPEYETRHTRYNKSQKGKARNANVQTRNRSSRYMQRQFVAWDGEGLNEKDGSHTYVLLSSSLGHKKIARRGLSTVEAFELFLSAPTDSRYTHIIYGGGYDFNMILRDLDRDSLQALYDEGTVKWNGYRINWRMGKSFSIRTRDRRILIYDVLPFFQRSFVSACDEYLGNDWENRDGIIAEKANRGSFSFEDIEAIDEYNGSELRNLVRLADELRERLDKVGIHVARWDGPGAIAGALYKRYNTKSHLGTTPSEVAEAARYAYAGGRFELIRKGHSPHPIWQYDINSAYPNAIQHLPCLQHATWRRVRMPKSIVPFGIYRIQVINPVTQSPTQPQPLWHRNKDGTVFFSEYPHGWYWSPEAQLALELGGVNIYEGWELVRECDCEPFEFVPALYRKRAALKKAGDGAHIGIKLGLNSLYGKLAQQIGWDPGPPLKLPPYHCLEWAGWITSHCRAKLYRASMQAPDDIVAFETDAVFSRVPLDLPLSSALGDWEETTYDDITYLKSGMYWASKDGKEIEKTRGFNKGSVSRDDVIAAIRADGFYDGVLNAEQTRFITLGQALHQDFSLWRRWVTSPRFISAALNGKRIDLLTEPYADKGDGFGETQEGFHDTEFSYPYHVEWIDGELLAPDGTPVSVLRKMDEDSMFGWDYD